MKEQHKVILSVFTFLILLTTVATLVILGILQSWAIYIGSLGWIAHGIFFLLFVMTALPFGWGYAMFLQVLGFIYGWQGAITAQICTLLSGIISFYISRHCLQNYATKKVKTFKPKRKKLIDAARTTLSKGQGSTLLFFSVIRMTPALAYGWINGLCGALTEMNITTYVTTLMVGHQLDIWLNIFLGKIAREANDSIQKNNAVVANVTVGNATTPKEESDIEGTMLIVQIILAIFLLIATTFWAQTLMKKIIEETEDVENIQEKEKKENEEDTENN